MTGSAPAVGPPHPPVPVFLGPDPQSWLREAVERGGGAEAPLAEAAAVVWFGFPHGFPELPDSVRWVQLPFAGIEPWTNAGLLGTEPNGRVWTNGAGVYAETVAEHALAMLLAGVRGLPAAQTVSTWDPGVVGPVVGTLRGSTVGVIGAGGIGQALIPMLRALKAGVIAVNRSGRTVEIEGQPPIETVRVDALDEVLPRCDHVVLSAPATEATQHLIGEAQLKLLRSHSWVVNVGRGALIDTDALTAALRDKAIGGAGLDVTEPEPLPDGHELWSLPNAIVTPHVANPPRGITALLAVRVEENVRRFREGRELLGVVDARRGY